MAYLREDKPVSDGEILGGSYFDLISHPVFKDGPLAGKYTGYLPGHKDENLSDDPTQLKTRFVNIETCLKVVKGSNPLTVRVMPGGVRLQDGTPVTKESQQYNVPDNTVSYVYLDPTGATQVSTVPTPTRLILAKVIASAGELTIEDWRSRVYLDVLPRTDIISIFGGNGQEGDFLATAGQTVTLDKSLYSYRNFTVQAGATVIIDKFARIHCSGDFTVNGQITITPGTSGGAIWALALTNNTRQMGHKGDGIGGGAGSSTISGKTYSYAMQAFGSGGGSGVIEGTQGIGAASAGGMGGGGLVIESAGNIYIGGTITAKGTNGTPGNLYTVNPNGTPITTIGAASGGGGGSGGLIYLASTKSVVSSLTSTLDVSAGNGAPGVEAGSYPTGAYGGSGGGGGQVVCVSPVINLTGATINLNGGLYGASSRPNPGIGGSIGGGFGGEGGVNELGNGNIGDLVLRIFTPQPL